jgi:hypothetical protein
MKFLCLKRARLAKTSVLERILERRVSDGQWIADPGERQQGVEYFKSLRDEYLAGKPVDDILHEHPEMQICYRADLNLHEVSFHA